MKWHVSGIESNRFGILVEANSEEEAKELAKDIDLNDWTDGGENEFLIDFVGPWEN